MAARAICKNCERNMAIMQEGLCGGCFGRARGLSGEEKDKALAKAREDFKGKGPVSRGNHTPRVKAPKATPRKPKVEGRARRDPASGEIASAGVQDPGAQVERNVPGANVTLLKTGEPVFTPDQLKALGINMPQCPFWPLPGDSDLPPGRIERLNPPDAIDSVTIHFTAADSALSEGLLSLSRKNRRSPDQQLLWLLECELKEMPSRDGVKV